MKSFVLGLLLAFSSLHAFSLDKTLSPVVGTTDYAPVILGMVNEMIAAGGIGTLTIQPGQYPVLSEIRMKNPAGKERVKINIIGVLDSQGNRPKLYDTRLNQPPHSFLIFDNLIDYDRRIWGAVLNLEFEGNNQPNSSSHPWINKHEYPRACIQALGSLSLFVENCIIKNQYGTGIEMSNYYDQNKERRVEYPRIRKTQILNCWAWDSRDATGDGIAMWNVESPEIDSVVIRNDMNVTKWLGRVGIVIEHLTEKAKVTNCKIHGYDRSIHAECTYGGHLIENNEISGSKVSVHVNEYCSTLMGPLSNVSYTTINKNIFKYNQEQELGGFSRNDWGMVNVYDKHDYQRGLRITNNQFIYTLNPAVDPLKNHNRPQQKRPELYINLKGQKGVVLDGNTFK